MLDDPRAPKFMLPGDSLNLDGVLYVARWSEEHRKTVWLLATDGDIEAMCLIAGVLNREPKNG